MTKVVTENHIIETFEGIPTLSAPIHGEHVTYITDRVTGASVRATDRDSKEVSREQAFAELRSANEALKR